MRKSKLIKSFLFFLLVTALPLLKIFLLGAFDSDEQVKYIKIYFWLQFLVPVVDLGYYWSIVRVYIDEKQVATLKNKFNLVGFSFVLFVLPFSIFYAQLLMLAVVTAWYNFNLQIFRIEGSIRSYYFSRFGKIFLDIVFVLILFFISDLSVEKLIAAEFFAISIVSIFIFLKNNTGEGMFTFSCSSLLSLDYMYVIIKVLRSNLCRLLIPFLFFGESLEYILFAVLFYELAAQYFSIEKLQSLLAGKIKVFFYLLVYLFSLPVQYVLIFFLGEFMHWNFGFVEISCVIFGGAARIFSVYTLNIVKNSAFNLLVYINVFLVVFGVIEMYSFYALYTGEASAKLSLLLFYAVEALVGLGLVIWVEGLRIFKRI